MEKWKHDSKKDMVNTSLENNFKMIEKLHERPIKKLLMLDFSHSTWTYMSLLCCSNLTYGIINDMLPCVPKWFAICTTPCALHC